MDLNTDITPFTKVNRSWIMDLNVKHKIIKLLEDIIGENLGDLGYRNILVDPTLKEKDKTGRLMLLDFRTYYKAIESKQCGIHKR